jgi:hypothetical protein
MERAAGKMWITEAEEGLIGIAEVKQEMISVVPG